VPGDEIVGFVTRGRGVSIHRTDCINIINISELDRVRLIEAEWQGGSNAVKGEKFLAEITVYAENRTGLLGDISKVFTERDIDLQSLNSRISKQGVATISMSFLIGGVSELNKIIASLKQIDNIIDIER